MTGSVSGSSSLPEGERRTDLQRLTALVQHKLTHPLAALLAEAQLLGMEPSLEPEQAAAVERVVALTRRVIGIVRELDTVVQERLGH